MWLKYFIGSYFLLLCSSEMVDGYYWSPCQGLGIWTSSNSPCSHINSKDDSNLSGLEVNDAVVVMRGRATVIDIGSLYPKWQIIIFIMKVWHSSYNESLICCFLKLYFVLNLFYWFFFLFSLIYMVNFDWSLS